MDFQLTDDQRAIAEMAGSLFGDLCTDDRLRAFDTAGEPFMADLWKQCVETGLHALAIPEEAGGTGLGMTELMLVLEAQGRQVAHLEVGEPGVPPAPRVLEAVRLALPEQAVATWLDRMLCP